MTPAERASAFKARWWAISHGWSARLDEADLREAFAAAESSALERAAHRLEEIAHDYEGRKLRSVAMDETVEAAFLEQMARAAWRCVKAVYELKSPAAAPAAEPSESAAPATDPERDRNQHNAMLVEAWRKEFAVLCETLFPGNDGPIGWKHVQAKVAALAAPMATECAMDKDGTCASEHVGLPRAPAAGEEGGREPYPDPRCTCHARHDGKHAQSCELWNTTGDL